MDLKRVGVCLLLTAFVVFPAPGTPGEAAVLVPLVAVLVGLGVLVWLTATVADAMVRSLKKEN